MPGLKPERCRKDLYRGLRRNDLGVYNTQSRSVSTLKQLEAISPIGLEIAPNGDLHFRHFLMDGTEAGDVVIRAGTYRFDDGRIVIADQRRTHTPDAHFIGLGQTH